MPYKNPLKWLRPVVRITGFLTGKIKDFVAADVAKGEKENDLIVSGLKLLYKDRK